MTSTHSNNTEKPSTPSPLADLIAAVAAEDMNKVDALLADDVEWDMMSTGQTVKGKAGVMNWLKAGSTSRKEPEVINDLTAKGWGAYEYWNIGTVTDELVVFGNQQNWPWPKDPKSLIGQKYKVAQCFIWRVNGEGKICLMKQYLDTGSVWAQFK